MLNNNFIAESDGRIYVGGRCFLIPSSVGLLWAGLSQSDTFSLLNRSGTHANIGGDSDDVMLKLLPYASGA